MSDLASALRYWATAERIVDSAGNVVAERERRRGIKALILSKTIVDTTGRPLLKVFCRRGRIISCVDVFTPQDGPLAHIKGKAFFARPAKFTIRAGNGSTIGRIERRTWLDWEFLLLDNEDRLRARGVKTGRKAGTEWAVEIQDGPHASPWPELIAGFFLGRNALETPSTPP